MGDVVKTRKQGPGTQHPCKPRWHFQINHISLSLIYTPKRDSFRSHLRKYQKFTKKLTEIRWLVCIRPNFAPKNFEREATPLTDRE